MQKKSIADLAFFGGPQLYSRPVSTSNLVRPDVEAFLGLLRHAQTVTGEKALVQRLEKKLAEFHCVPHCVAVCNGFWALVLAIQALALPGRSEVIMPSLTYRRLADVVAWTGLVPRFCEVDPHTLAISSATAAPHIGPKTALIIGVHPIVNCCDASGLESLAKRHQVPILFDGVESVYETFQGRKVGSFGMAECFSFHASKLINGFEGGYITTRDSRLAQRLRRLRNPEDQHICSEEETILGIEANMPAAHAAMALQCLYQLPEQIEHNRHIYRTYQSLLPSVPGLALLSFDESEQTSFKNIVVKINADWPLSRESTIELLNAEGILSRAYYSPPLHQKKMQYRAITTQLPITEKASRHYMLMPCGYQVSTFQVGEVVKFLKFLYANADAIIERQENSA